jgi:hypothetical protein
MSPPQRELRQTIGAHSKLSRTEPDRRLPQIANAPVYQGLPLPPTHRSTGSGDFLDLESDLEELAARFPDQ